MFWHLKYRNGVNLSRWTFEQCFSNTRLEHEANSRYIANELKRVGYARAYPLPVYVPCTHRKARLGLCYRDSDLNDDGTVKRYPRGRAIQMRRGALPGGQK